MKRLTGNQTHVFKHFKYFSNLRLFGEFSRYCAPQVQIGQRNHFLYIHKTRLTADMEALRHISGREMKKEDGLYYVLKDVDFVRR